MNESTQIAHPLLLNNQELFHSLLDNDSFHQEINVSPSSQYRMKVLLGPMQKIMWQIIKEELHQVSWEENEEAIIDYYQAICTDQNMLNVLVIKVDIMSNIYIKAFALNVLGRKEEAIIEYSNAIAINPQDFNSYTKRGNILNNLNRKEDAIFDYSVTISINPQMLFPIIIEVHVLFHCYLGVTFSELGRNEDAIFDYQIAIWINPQYSQSYNNLGFAQINQEEKQSNFTKAIQIDPQYADAYHKRGIVLIELERNENALIDFSKAIEINPKFADAYFNRGNTLRDLRRIQDGMADYTKAIKINQIYIDAINQRSIYNYQINKLMKDMKNIKKKQTIYYINFKIIFLIHQKYNCIFVYFLMS